LLAQARKFRTKRPAKAESHPEKLPGARDNCHGIVVILGKTLSARSFHIMKTLLIALLATGLAGQAFAHAPSSQDQPSPAPAAAPVVPGAATAGQASKGALTAVYIGMGATAVAVVAGATSSSNHGNENNGGGGTSPGGTTGTTGTTGTN
jgi:hypothetical protein